jgi:hypothetical protein
MERICIECFTECTNQNPTELAREEPLYNEKPWDDFRI